MAYGLWACVLDKEGPVADALWPMAPSVLRCAATATPPWQAVVRLTDEGGDVPDGEDGLVIVCGDTDSGDPRDQCASPSIFVTVDHTKALAEMTRAAERCVMWWSVGGWYGVLLTAQPPPLPI